MRLSLSEKLRSTANHLGMGLRNYIKFSRAGYKESSDPALPFPPDAQIINQRYNAASVGPQLYPRHWIRTLATLWHLEQMFSGIEFPKSLEVLEPGSQDFSRLPAFRLYFRTRGITARFTGVEIDPYVPLSGLHSRWDKAQYYISFENDGSSFVASDFFKFQQISGLVICYYPFVSTAPALAWGIPATYASAKNWIKAFEQNLRPGGMALVIQQGTWEQDDFDEARKNSSLQLIRRQVLECPFLPSAHPMCASLYQKS